MRYVHCPRCGEKLIEKPAGDDGLVPYCETCGKFWFDAFGSCVIIMVVSASGADGASGAGGVGGECDANCDVLMLRQGYMSDQYMNFVSGYITVGENAEQAARREVREETGLELDELEYSGTWWFGEEELLMHGFIGYASSREVTLSPEVDEVRWIPLAELPDYMYPDMPGNAQQGTYRVYMQKHGSRE